MEYQGITCLEDQDVIDKIFAHLSPFCERTYPEVPLMICGYHQKNPIPLFSLLLRLQVEYPTMDTGS